MEDGDARGNSDLNPLALKRILPENSAEYMLFLVGGADVNAADSKPLARLESLRKAGLQLSEKLTRDYIWQRESFNLEVVSHNGLVYLHGVTDYGDCVEDEWLIVYILRELSKSFSDLWARICDGDGEFLLVEAARTVPKWLNPEIDANRVWIHDGQLRVVPLATEQADKSCTAVSGSSSITLAGAVQAIKSDSEGLLQIPALEAEAFYRLGKYPGQIEDSIHCARVLIPRKVAFVLHDRPQAIAPAVEAFYMRDPDITKRIFSSEQKKLAFPPTDLVNVSVRFTKILFAQLRGLRFTPPEAWSKEFAAHVRSVMEKESAKVGSMPSTDSRKIRIMANLGLKITCGFELMALTAEKNNSRVVREVGLVLEDLAEDGDDAGLLPTDGDMRSWKDFDRDDDESWLNINFTEFERELDNVPRNKVDESTPAAEPNSAGNIGASDNSGFGDSQVQADLQKMVSRFQAFLDDDAAGLDGVDMDQMDEDDDTDGEDSEADSSDVSFDEDTFSRLMREMMGLPPDTASAATSSQAPVQNIADTRAEHSSTTSATSRAIQRDAGSHDIASKSPGTAMDDTDDEDDISDLAAQFEAELKGHGALRLNPPSKGKQTTVTEGPSTGSDAANEPESDEEGEVDVDYNLVRNLLESFKSQAGMAGPAGNILGMMGLNLPRDDDEGEVEGKDEDGEQEPR